MEETSEDELIRRLLVETADSDHDRPSDWKGPDQYCQGWRPHRYNVISIRDLHRSKGPVPPGRFEGLRTKIIRAYLYFQLHFLLTYNLANRCYRIPEILYAPSWCGLSEEMKAKVALFRKTIIWPLFGSTREFWMAHLDYFKHAEDFLYEWPEDEADLGDDEIAAMLQGDAVGLKMHQVIVKYYGASPGVCKSTSNLIKVIDNLFE